MLGERKRRICSFYSGLRLAGIVAIFAGLTPGQGGAPTLTSVTPNSAVAHAHATAISLSGTNFASTSVVSFTPPGGTQTFLTPSQVQAAQMAATIPAALLSTAGTAQIAIQSGAGVLSNQLPFTINPSVSVKAQTLSAATVGTPYSAAVVASGGTSPYLWSVLSGALPAGLSLSSSGTISGTPTTAGPSIFAAQAVDASGAIASGSVTIIVQPPPFAITSGATPSGVVNFDYPKQILGATGGTPPYSFAISSGTLPAGISLTNGVIGGVPTTPGNSSFTITATDSAGATAQLNTSINVRAAAADLVLLSGNVSFALMTGATGLPMSQSVGVQSASVGQILNYTIATSTAPWLSVSGSGVTPGALTFSLTTAALSLSVGTNTATVVLTCTTAACSGKTQSVAVSLVVSSPPPVLSVSSGLLSFRTSSTPPQAQSQQLGIQNAGGGSLTLTSITCEASTWCSAGAYSNLVTGGTGIQVTITADPSTLKPGYYYTAVDIVSSAGTIPVPVSFLVASSAYMNLSQTGDQLSMQAGGSPGNPSGTFLVDATGGTFNWTATVLNGVNWVTLNSSSGTASDAKPGTVSYSVNSYASSLAAGTYYATIQVSSSGAVNSPLAFVLVLKVAAAVAPPTLDIGPAGLIFITNVGVTPPTQSIGLYTNSATQQTYQASPDTNGVAWLSAPASGTISASAPGHPAITVDPSSLSTPGFYFGHVNYALAGAGIRTLNVLLVLLPSGVTIPGLAQGPAPDLQPKASCSPSNLVLQHSGLSGNFAAPASWPTPLALNLLNDCGNVVSNGQVTATFSNGDPPLTLSLANSSSGLYSGTWTPRASASQVTITARATASGFQPVTAALAGSVLPNATPVLTPNGTVHPYNPQIGGALAPGTIVAIYGSNMASTATQPTQVPLPTAVNGTSVLIGGIPAPLFYVSAGQINAQIPFELDPAKPYQILVNANGALSTPLPIQMSAATPGLDAFADGTLVAVHSSTGALVSQSNPAKTNEFIVMFLLGMGPTDNPVTTGDNSPGDPLDRPLATPTLTLAGTPVPVAFAGLTPGLVGLYQINLQIPDVAVDGNLVLTVSQNGAVSNTTVLPVTH